MLAESAGLKEAVILDDRTKAAPGYLAGREPGRSVDDLTLLPSSIICQSPFLMKVRGQRAWDQGRLHYMCLPVLCYRHESKGHTEFQDLIPCTASGSLIPESAHCVSLVEEALGEKQKKTNAYFCSEPKIYRACCGIRGLSDFIHFIAQNKIKRKQTCLFITILGWLNVFAVIDNTSNSGTLK